MTLTNVPLATITCIHTNTQGDDGWEAVARAGKRQRLIPDAEGGGSAHGGVAGLSLPDLARDMSKVCCPAPLHEKWGGAVWGGDIGWVVLCGVVLCGVVLYGVVRANFDVPRRRRLACRVPYTHRI